MCFAPVTITRSYAGRYFMNNVPCNHCLECVKDRQNAYIIRTIEEQRKRGTMCFFTLTYAPESLPVSEVYDIDDETGEMSVNETQTLRRADVSKWLKMFKQKCKRNGVKLDFSYMISGEYGPKTQRPHYHGIILGLSQELCNELMWRWKTEHGFVCFKFIPSLMSDVEKVARYCAKYMVKNDEWKLVPEGAEKPRIMTTRYYGMPEPNRWKSMINYYQAQDVVAYDPNKPVFENAAEMYKVVREIIKRRKYRLGNGKEFKLPNYYKRKIFYDKTEGRERATAIQRMVTYNVQRDFDKDFKEELHNLASLYDLGTYSQAVDKYNVVHADDMFYRAKRYEESDLMYMRKSVY